MEQNSTSNLQQTLTDNLRQLSTLSLSLAKPLMDNVTENFSSVSKSFLDTGVGNIRIPQFKLQGDDCCFPKNECPPHCIASINRTAMSGERIIIPFMIKNNCNVQRTYRVGARELKDADGKMAPSQPVLNKSSVTLAAGQQERVLIALDLANFQEGGTYYMEVVLREKEYNQNVCITVHIGDNNTSVVAPVDEKKYRMRWQSWKDHFYCETRPGRQQG